MIGGRFGRLRDRVGLEDGRESRVYPNLDDSPEPQDVADPHTLKDETAQGWFERMTRSGPSAAVTIVFVLLIAVGAVILGYYFSTFFATLIGNPWFQGLVGATGLFTAAFVMGSSRAKSKLKNVDELTVKHVESGRPLRFRGEYDADSNGYIFRPYKGTRGLLFKQWEPLTKGELVGDTINPKTPAAILLPQPEFAHAMTDLGEVGVMKVKRFAPFAAAGEANVRAVLPDDGSKDTIKTARQELSKLHADIEDYEERLNAMETRLRNANERAGRPHEQVMDESLRWVALLRYLQPGNEFDLSKLLDGAPADVRDEIERLDEELSADD